MNNTLSAASVLTPEIIVRMVAGEVPSEFPSSNVALNEADGAEWARPIFVRARRQLERHLAKGGARDKKTSPDCCVFAMAKHNYPLTVSMKEAGWEQWQSTIETRTREWAAANGVKFRKFRYAVHFWVGPKGEIVLGKIKIQGKHIPETVCPTCKEWGFIGTLDVVGPPPEACPCRA